MPGSYQAWCCIRTVAILDERWKRCTAITWFSPWGVELVDLIDLVDVDFTRFRIGADNRLKLAKAMGTFPPAGVLEILISCMHH